VSLLEKWCWMLLVDREGLWYRVLKARYGEVEGRIKEGGRYDSRWWRSICKVREGSGMVVGGWFDNNIRRVVGNGRETLFWTDNWLGGVPLKLHFSRLYELVVHKECSVEEMMRERWERGGGRWVWRRRLLAWEEESVRECASLLNNVVLQDNFQDRWRCLLEPNHGYLVSGVYRYLTTSLNVSVVHDVWHKLVPSKVSLFAWRLLQDRIPTRTNLVRRNVLQSIDNACVTGCGSVETTDHLFRCCDISGSVWYLLCQWLGVTCVFPGSVTDHYFQFIHLAGLPLCTHSYLKVIWLACSWAIWKERNKCVFNNAVLDPFSIVDKVKLNSFLWLSSHSAPIAFGFHDWWRYPLLCMGVL